MRRLFALAVASILAGSPALAHTGIGHTTGFASGVAHPIGGLDHVLAMVAVGLFAAFSGGRALWLVPLSFIAMMAGGGALGMAGIGIPRAELGIGLSIVAFGAAVALRLKMPVALAMAFAGCFAIFHGHAHGTEMPETASGLAYGVGFVLATGSLHAAGIVVALASRALSDRHGRDAARMTGGAMALAGAGIPGRRDLGSLREPSSVYSGRPHSASGRRARPAAWHVV